MPDLRIATVGVRWENRRLIHETDIECISDTEYSYVPVWLSILFFTASVAMPIGERHLFLNLPWLKRVDYDKEAIESAFRIGGARATLQLAKSLGLLNGIDQACIERYLQHPSMC